MIIYLDEEGPYLSWVTHHRDGFVLDWRRQPTRRHPMIHRATCAKIRVSRSKPTHWTTGQRLKACSRDLESLVTWAEHQSGHPPNFCEECSPESAGVVASLGNDHLTKLEREILDYVLEIAILHLDNPRRQYQLTVSEIADCLDKTTGQIATPLWHLIERDYLTLPTDAGQKDDIKTTMVVYPLSKALRTEPAFESLSESELTEELNGLRHQIRLDQQGSGDLENDEEN